MNTLPPLPIGFMAMYPGAQAPDGWRICDGSSISRTEIPDSFDELARTLGQSSEETEGVAADSLQLPNLRDRFVVGAGADAELRSRGEADQHTHQNDPPPQRRYTSYGDQFMDAESTRYFYEESAETVPVHEVYEEVLEHNGMEARMQETVSDGLDQMAPISLEHHNHYVELDIEPFESEPSEGLNRPKYYALNFVIRVA